jgi:radical SAM superfamily enzyme YgiQ (UPF0313 family)
MRHLRDHFGVWHVNFYDDLFAANRRRILALCELLARSPLGMHFNCAVRVGEVDDELLGALKRAGCHQVSMGIESAAPDLLTRHKSGVTIEQARDTARRTRAAGLRIKGLFIFGLPGETPETVRATSDFIQSMGFDEINISKFSPFHGAPLWDACVAGREGVFHEDWRLMNCLHFTYRPSAFRSRQEMDYLYNQCIERFYRGKDYQWLFIRRLWQHRWSCWHLLRHLIPFTRVGLRFKPDVKQLAITDAWPPLHRFQPKIESEPALSIDSAL